MVRHEGTCRLAPLSAIPRTSRVLVEARDRNRCARCGGAGSDWHHRRSRRVVGVHQHSPANGLLLCRTCHEWVHANPLMARLGGFIVSMHEKEPGSVAVVHALFGPVLLDETGGWSHVAVGDE